jgi:hypothetical protein
MFRKFEWRSGYVNRDKKVRVRRAVSVVRLFWSPSPFLAPIEAAGLQATSRPDQRCQSLIRESSS